MEHLVFFSALYLILACMIPVMGYYVLRLNFKGTINRLFFIISLCLTMWALGFSIIILAPNESTAIVWTKVSAIGYETIYSVLLHFTLLLTGHSKILNKKWIYPLLYLPAGVCLYAFVLSPGITGEIYHFANTESGWLRTTGIFIYDRIFQLYYLSAVIGSLILIALWKNKSDRPEIKKQANLLMISFTAAFGLGSFTDIINGLYKFVPIPQMAVLFFLIPLSAIFYCINRYHLMKPQLPHKTEEILSDIQRASVFRITSIGFVAGGVVLFIMQYLWWEARSYSLLLIAGALLIFLGGILHYARQNGKGFVQLELTIMLTTTAITPLLVIYVAKSGAMMLWLFPIVMMICALVFNSDNVLLSSVVSMIFSQLYLASTAPYQEIVIDYRMYISQVVVLLFIIVSAYSVHRIYITRLKENAAQAKTQALVSSIVAGFTLADEEHIDESVGNLLEELSAYFKAELVFIHAFEESFHNLIGEQVYCADGSRLSRAHKQKCLSRWDIYRQENLSKASASPYEQYYEQYLIVEQIERMKASSYMFIPIFSKENPVAFIYIETTRVRQAWTNEQVVTRPVVSRLVSDALDKLNAEMRIKFMAYYDGLTKLPNRQLFYERAEQALELAKRNNTASAVLFLDVDSFKSINDTLGHEGGDLLIQTIAQKLSDSLRANDTIARFGGDEFLILINEFADREHLSALADQVMSNFKEPIMLHEQEIFITASIGIAMYPRDGENTETLIKHADIAMYTAKEKGKNQYAFCSTDMKDLVQYRASLSNKLYRALERNEFQVYYQPQIDLQTEKIIGLEALMRWNLPGKGMVSPLEFIPLAEQTGLINPIGNWILETACAQVVEWKQMGLGDLRIAVNLSVVQLRNPGFVKQVERILAQTGIQPSLVELEITESTTTKEADYIIQVLNELKSLGVTISIDDFGTEYSSLNRLKMLPIDKIKMDIQFVRGIDESPKEQAITLIIMNLAKSLDLKLIAEGVESSSQLNFLKSRMCDEVQGFYYYKPMPAAEIATILAQQEQG